MVSTAARWPCARLSRAMMSGWELCIVMPYPIPQGMSAVILKASPIDLLKKLMPLEVLHLAFVLLGGLARFEGAEVPAFAGPGIDFTRIETVFAGLQLADHGDLLCGFI